MNKEVVSLQVLLKQYFGFESFRPYQEEIISDALAGKDVFALLPTGGGKSLCFQLPALAQPGLTVVVSPLIALMKDQVDSLRASGVEAVFLNSSLAPAEARERLRRLHQGEVRLLYVAPERLLLPDFLAALQKWNVRLIAVDEAHCISEWGHDFRPEYRQISQLRGLFPGIPIMALTATATKRVRDDILGQLQLREARCYAASFDRPNLTYRVLPKVEAYAQTFEFIRARRGESGIVYCQSRRGTETLAERLQADGLQAAPYHAGMEASARAANQELWLRDELRVICATIAFGMGVNKPNVRFVLHYDLPKNIESYYQETGRAGRDGLPSDCLLLFCLADVMKQQRFIEQKPDAQEQEIARAQLRRMIQYADESGCRRAALLSYFGEVHPGNCQGCDNCLTPREVYDATLAAQKFLSCVYRIRERSGFNVGMAHVVAVLTGANTEKIRKWGHHELSTYAIGHEHSRTEWIAIGRELVQIGLLRQDTAGFNTLDLTTEGRATLRERRPIRLTKPVTVDEVKQHRSGEIACDEALFQQLRILRKRLADERGLPPYIIFSDVSLRKMARVYPLTHDEFGLVTGVGQRKRLEFGQIFVHEIAEFLRNHPRQIFADDSFEMRPRPVRWRSRNSSRKGE